MDCKETLKRCNDLSLNKVTFPDIPEEIIFPEELNKYLREQIMSYMHENGMLKKELSEMERMASQDRIKFDKLLTKLKQYENISNSTEYVGANQVASCKIVELTKKLREKNAEVECLKTKYFKLEKHVSELNKELEISKRVTEIKTKGNPVLQQYEEVKKIQDKLNVTNSKLSETRNLNLQLKNELKIAMKILQQETGENVESIQNLINCNFSNNWRGRAQIIHDLQQKNAQLKEKLRIHQVSILDNVPSNMEFVKSETSTKISLLSQENTGLKCTYESTKKKHDALKARCRVLDSELTSLKSKFLIMNEQSERDKDVMLELRSQLSGLEQSKKDLLKQKENIISKLQTENTGLNNEVGHLKSIIKEMKVHFDEKSDDLRCQQINNRNENIGNNFDQHELEKVISHLEVEKIKLTELLEIQNKRLKDERDSHDKTQLLLKMEKQASAKFEANLARIEFESKSYTSLSGYSTSSQANLKALQTYKNELELANENIKVLKTRLEIEQQEKKIDFQKFLKILGEFQANFIEK